MTRDDSRLHEPVDPAHPAVPHADPAVQALIDDGWLEESDQPIDVAALEHAVSLVREVDAERFTDNTPESSNEQMKAAGALLAAWSPEDFRTFASYVAGYRPELVTKWSAETNWVRDGRSRKGD